MTVQLTGEQLTAKLWADCSHCPNCGSDDLDAGRLSPDGPNAVSEVECKNCGCRWREHYQFTRAELTSTDCIKQPQAYLVRYAIFSLSTSSVVHGEELRTSAYSRHDAVAKAERHVVDHDPYWDERIDPIFQLIDVCEIVEEESAEEDSADG
jgi:hypothetical protein